MKKYITGAIIGAAIMFGGYALAATAGTSGLGIVDRLNIGGNNTFVKIYDKDANVICYFVQTYEGGEGAGISCLKN